MISDFGSCSPLLPPQNKTVFKPASKKCSSVWGRRKVFLNLSPNKLKKMNSDLIAQLDRASVS